MSKAWERAKTAAAIAVSPIADKNPLKIWAYRAPVVLSAERIICIGAFVLWSWVIYRNPELLNGWPAATFGVFIVLALPITRALSRAPTEMALKFAETLVGRLGRGRGAQLIRGTSASSTTPVLPEYEDTIDDLYEESDPAGLGYTEIGFTDHTAPTAEEAPRTEAPAADEEAPAPVASPPQPGKLEGITVVADRKPDTEPATAKPAPSIKTPTRPIDQPHPNDPPWLTWALKERHILEDTRPGESNPRIAQYAVIGKTGYPPPNRKDADAVPWCSNAACASLEAVGVRSPRSAAARDFLDYGQVVNRIGDERRGDFVVLDRRTADNPRSAHVTQYLFGNATHVWGWGGNQNNRWSVQKYPRERIVGIRRPN